jgi:hypothetical protein
MSITKNTWNSVKADTLTAEGVLVWATNVVLALAAVLPGGLNWTHAAAYMTVLNAVHVFATRFTQIRLIQSQTGFGQPTPFNPVDPSVIADVAGAATGANDAPAEPENRLAAQHPDEANSPESTPPYVPLAQEQPAQEAPAAPQAPAPEAPVNVQPTPVASPAPPAA